jgi:hypothetical protein
VVITGGTDQAGFPIYVLPNRINNLGEVAGTRKVGLANGLPITWTTETGVVPLPKPPGVPEVEIQGLNDNGWLVLDSQVDSYRAFIVPYEARATAQWIKIEPLQLPGRSHARGINNLNQVVGHRTRADAPPNQLLPYSAFIWSQETGEAQEILVNAEDQPSCGLSSINDAGTMLGWSSSGAEWTSNTNAFLLEDGQQVPIPAPHKLAGMMPRDLNQQGYGVIIEQVKPAPGITLQHSYITKDGELLCELPAWPGYPWSNGLAINAQGVVAGACRNPVPGAPTIGTVWFNGVPYSPTELAGIEPDSADSVSYLVDINDKGQLLGQTKSKTKIILLTPSGMPGDVDCDGAVGPEDLAILLGAWGPGGTRSDIDLDGVVDGVDLGVLLAAWTG